LIYPMSSMTVSILAFYFETSTCALSRTSPTDIFTVSIDFERSSYLLLTC
jgi:hypothetical protein